jgi:hypothetical protein
MTKMLAAALLASSATIAAQQPLPQGEAPRKAPPAPIRAAHDAPANYTPKKLIDGQPDISGDWSSATYTPLERPAELKDKATFTPEEAAAYAQRRLDGLYAQAKDNIHYDDAIWQSEKTPKGAERACGRRSWSIRRMGGSRPLHPKRRNVPTPRPLCAAATRRRRS